MEAVGLPWLYVIAAVVGLLACLIATADAILGVMEGEEVKYELIPTLLIVLLLLVLIYRM